MSVSALHGHTAASQSPNPRERPGRVGIGQSITDKSQALAKFHQIAIPDQFVDHGKLGELRDDFGFSVEKIAAQVLEKSPKIASLV